MARRITERLTFYTDGDEALAKQLEAQLADDKDARSGRIRFDSRKIERLERGPGAESEVVLTMKGGDQVTEGFLSHQPPTVPNGPFAQQLALELNQPSGEIKTTYPFQETSSRGVFAVGDCASPLKAVAMAIVSGATAAAGISFQLGPELAKAEESG
ncbi:hypothetical protein VTK73DRAFT_5624 [Phialemonium thermophilum]|uniref:FAD/NAD(P)-binding domain-containing protein n=1 Tax=Phialemonium thermophilum TaxID=223376 RepID=A0ABR3V246_9PEZI